MGTLNPPDGWDMVSGTWGVDADQDATVTPITGPYAVAMTTAAGATIWSDLKYVEGGRPYRGDAVIRAGRRNAGDIMRAYANWYTELGVLISTTYIHNGLVAVINTWEQKTAILLAPSTARIVRLFIEKAATATAFDGRFDRITLQRAPYAFAARRDASAQTFTNGAWTKMTFDVEEYDHGAAFTPATGTFECQEAGLYHFDAEAAMDGCDDTEAMSIGIHVNGTLYRRGGRCIAAAANQETHVSVGADAWLAFGDTVDVRVFHNSGANDTEVLGDGHAWFDGHQMAPFGFG